MALIKCPECGKEVSSKASSCPQCGFPIENNEELILKDDSQVDDKINDKKASDSIEEPKAEKKDDTSLKDVLMFILFLAFIVFALGSCCAHFLNSGDDVVDSNDGRCDICNKKAATTIYGEEFCRKHAANAIEYYYNLE